MLHLAYSQLNISPIQYFRMETSAFLEFTSDICSFHNKTADWPKVHNFGGKLLEIFLVGWSRNPTSRFSLNKNYLLSKDFFAIGNLQLARNALIFGIKQILKIKKHFILCQNFKNEKLYLVYLHEVLESCQKAAA